MFCFTLEEKKRFCKCIAKIKEPVINQCAEIGNLEALMFLVELGYLYNAKTIEIAAEKGHLEIVLWLEENGCPWNRWLFLRAAERRHIEIINWLREDTCFWKNGELHMQLHEEISK